MITSAQLPGDNNHDHVLTKRRLRIFDPIREPVEHRGHFPSSIQITDSDTSDTSDNTPVDSSGRDCMIHVLSLEYQTLRAEILVRTGGRFQFLGLMTAAAALLATAAFSHPLFSTGNWVAGILAIAIFGFGLMNFWILGCQIFGLSARVAEIENRINALAPMQAAFPALLNWELRLQESSRLARISMTLLPRRTLYAHRLNSSVNPQVSLGSRIPTPQHTPTLRQQSECVWYW
jgi:hypothetical protein